MAEQRVAKRKTHTKSRKGCFQCKQRHTKCNEARPRCANCVRLDIQCTFPTIKNGYSTSPQASTGDASPFGEQGHSGSPDLISSPSTFELSLPDMRLVHHWTSQCYKSMQPSSSIRGEAWQNAFMELGFEHHFLLHGLLALAAAHKASFVLPADRQSLLLQADSHISRALETYRKHLETPNMETAIPMFILSSVLLTYNFGSAQERPEDPIGSLHHCFMLLQGIKVVIVPHWEHIMESAVFAALTDSTSPSALEALDEIAKNDKSQDILRLTELTELLLDTQDKEACTDAINDLHTTWLRFRHVAPERDEYTLLFQWPARLNNRFLDLLAAHNPVSCIITTHFAALLAQGRKVWWTFKWPKWLLTASEQLLAATPDLLRWLDWPQQIINQAWSAITTPASS
ncbi:hypothetical protein BKA66DRAFT_515029 [Pyrenochaeta sp. MPI-SDFR-AT-0127]|nr:hypothetical protein BKA66DRAFT_515029 [Pyrenochaeta sp. MPI-SDFR-AT-0127]